MDVMYAAAAWMQKSGYFYKVKETLIKYLYRHAGEYDLQDVGNVVRGHGVRSDQHPVNNCFDLILA